LIQFINSSHFIFHLSTVYVGMLELMFVVL